MSENLNEFHKTNKGAAFISYGYVSRLHTMFPKKICIYNAIHCCCTTIWNRFRNRIVLQLSTVDGKISTLLSLYSSSSGGSNRYLFIHVSFAIKSHFVLCRVSCHTRVACICCREHLGLSSGAWLDLPNWKYNKYLFLFSFTTCSLFFSILNFISRLRMWRMQALNNKGQLPLC